MKQIDDIKYEMKKVYLADDRPWIIGYSGGKDSTVLLQLVYEMLLELDANKRKKIVYVISSDTLVENPIISQRLRKTSEMIGEKAKADNLPIVTEIVYPKYSDSFWTNIIGRGFPTPKSVTFRWCTERLKIEPSNRFIKNRVAEDGEAIVLLGVRKDESQTRKQSIESREIDGYILTPHNSLKKTYIYSPIVELTTDEIWQYLLKDGGKNPWGGSNNSLFELYEDGAGGECPFILTNGNTSPSCGNTRFGCWTCTVVNEDKSLLGFIETGEHWLIPLAEFREWIMQIRDNRKYRAKKQRTGRIYRRKILLKNISDEEKEMYFKEGYEVKIDENGSEYFWIKGLGPFNYEGRKLILKKLLETEDKVGIKLIRDEELKEIEKIWHEEFDLRRTALSEIYKEVKGKDVPWSKTLTPIFDEDTINKIDEAINKFDVEKDLYYRLLILTENNKIYKNKTSYRKSLDKLLNQQWLHRDIYDEEYITNDN